MDAGPMLSRPSGYVLAGLAESIAAVRQTVNQWHSNVMLTAAQFWFFRSSGEIQNW
jgi:hypothetical protein